MPSPSGESRAPEPREPLILDHYATHQPPKVLDGIERQSASSGTLRRPVRQG